MGMGSNKLLQRTSCSYLMDSDILFHRAFTFLLWTTCLLFAFHHIPLAYEIGCYNPLISCFKKCKTDVKKAYTFLKIAPY